MSEFTVKLDKVLARWARWPSEVKEAQARNWQRPVRVTAQDTREQITAAFGEWTREREAEAARIAREAAAEAFAEAKQISSDFLRRYDSAKTKLQQLANEAAANVDWARYSGLVELYKAKLAATQAEPALGESLAAVIESWVNAAGDDQTALAALAVATTPTLVKARDNAGGSDAVIAARLLRRLHAPVEPIGPEADAAREELAELRRKLPELVGGISALQRALSPDSYKASVLGGQQSWLELTLGNRAFNLDWTPKAGEAAVATYSEHVVNME